MNVAISGSRAKLNSSYEKDAGVFPDPTGEQTLACDPLHVVWQQGFMEGMQMMVKMQQQLHEKVLNLGNPPATPEMQDLQWLA